MLSPQFNGTKLPSIQTILVNCLILFILLTLSANNRGWNYHHDCPPSFQENSKCLMHTHSKRKKIWRHFSIHEMHSHHQLTGSLLTPSSFTWVLSMHKKVKLKSERKWDARSHPQPYYLSKPHKRDVQPACTNPGPSSLHSRAKCCWAKNRSSLLASSQDGKRQYQNHKQTYYKNFSCCHSQKVQNTYHVHIHWDW